MRLVALCDADRGVLDKQAKRLQDAGKPVECYTDVPQGDRKQEHRRDLDRHAEPLALARSPSGPARRARTSTSRSRSRTTFGKGRKIVEAARKYSRIVQTGTQSRSTTALREALDWAKAGNLGKIKSRAASATSGGPASARSKGHSRFPHRRLRPLVRPGPEGPLTRKKLHYDWHWVWTGNGDSATRASTRWTSARWALGKNRWRRAYFSVGGRFGYDDDGETPNTQFVVHDYGDTPLIFEVRGLPAKPGGKEMDVYRSQSVGHVIECEGGYIAGTTAYDNQGKEIKKFTGSEREAHFENFIKAVRSRKPSDLNAPILEGHLSSALCHTGNISYQLGKQTSPEEIQDALKADKAACETLERFTAHLATHGIDLKSTKPTFGPHLKMDPKTERFIGNDKANQLLTQEYRKPFVVTEKV